MNEFFHEVLFAFTDFINDAIDLFVTKECTLSTDDGTRSGPQYEHVTITEKLFCTHFVKHNTAIGTTGNLERNTCRQV